MNAHIVPMSERRFEMIPVDRIVVLNSRNRDKQQFAMNVRSIEELGQLQPIVVSARNLERTGLYDLVCGEGRLLAHRQLGVAEIAAEVTECDHKIALLKSLVENIARVPRGAMWFARELKRMHDDGFSFAKLASIVGKDQTYVSDYVHLVEQGEDRLIEGIENNLFSMSFAVQVAQSDDSTIQNVLMDAFDVGLVNCNTVTRVRKLLELRMNRGRSPQKQNRSDTAAYTVKDLVQEITKVTKGKEDFVREATRKENRLLALLMGTSTLLADARFQSLLATHDLGSPPELAGQYAVDFHRMNQQTRDQSRQEAAT